MNTDFHSCSEKTPENPQTFVGTPLSQPSAHFGFLIRYLTLREDRPLGSGLFTSPSLIPPIFSVAFWERTLVCPTKKTTFYGLPRIFTD
jgi:hypothetical protein